MPLCEDDDDRKRIRDGSDDHALSTSTKRVPIEECCYSYHLFSYVMALLLLLAVVVVEVVVVVVGELKC